MKNYQYQILRYRHDIATGEFVNVGIVVYHPESGFLKTEVLNKYARISQFFENVNGQFIVGMLKAITKRINEVAQDIPNQNSLEQITNAILPKDDGSLYFTELMNGMDIDMEIALKDLFERFVNKHQPKDVHYNTDEKVWREMYKKYFDEYGITSKLSKHTIETPTDAFVFDKTYKNGVMNVFEPSSFDLREESSIKDKVYKWDGKLSELDTYNEIVNLYLLTSMPTTDKLRKFVEQKLLHKKLTNIKIYLIKENEAEKFAKDLKKQMETHSH